MKRRIVTMTLLLGALGACSRGEEPAARASEAPAASAWIQPPRIDAVAVDGNRARDRRERRRPRMRGGAVVRESS